MKEVMKRIDQSGTYCFSDDHVGQQNLFAFDDPGSGAEQMRKHFAGKAVSYAEVNDYALNDSAFVNPKAMLAVLEKANLISVDAGGQQRSKGTYPERLHAMLHIMFKANDA
jgi:hypothetical protein